MSEITSLWVEKYRPKTLDDFIFQDKNQLSLIAKFVLNQEIPHLLFSGVQGSGKSSLSKILITELDIHPVDVLTINGSDENSVDVMREKIVGFCSTFPMGRFKVVRIEECDYLSLNAMAILRHVLEQYEQTRFILTCNYVNKIIPAIISRVQHFKFSTLDKTATVRYITNILETENISFSDEILSEYISLYSPDIRKIVNELQKNTLNGCLLPIASGIDNNSDYKIELLELIKNNNWKRIRTLLCEKVTNYGEWEEIYSFVFENLVKCEKFKNEKAYNNAVILLSDTLFRHSLSTSHPEITASAFFIKLGDL